VKTLSFIGSDKNAGKTTVFNFVFRKLLEDPGQDARVCLTSIGINGEEVDSYEGHPKPLISLYKDSYFVTACEHLKELTGKYEICFSFSDFNKLYILGKCLSDFQVVLEGPNNRQELLRLKKVVADILPDSCLLIDGSIDRQFLAHPDISDGFYFALLISDRKEQVQKAQDLLYSLSFPVCSENHRLFLTKTGNQDTKTILYDQECQVLYHGSEIPSFDANLKNACMKYKNAKTYLYMNGAFSKSLYTFFTPFKNLKIILDNFTLYQNISVRENLGPRFSPEIILLHPVTVNKIFLKQDTGKTGFPGLPKNIPVINLFRENPHEIGI
jgi:hypothetical protein